MPAPPGVSTTFRGCEGSGGVFTPVGRKCDARGLEDPPHLSLDVRARGDALAILLDRRLLEAVEIADQIIPFDADLVGSAEVGQLLLQHQREELAEDMAADRRVAGVVDRPRAQLHLRPSEQILNQEQLSVPKHRIERCHRGVGPEHEDAVEAGLLGQLAGIDLERLAGAGPPMRMQARSPASMSDSTIARSEWRANEAISRSSSPLAWRTSLRPNARIVRWRTCLPSRTLSTR